MQICISPAEEKAKLGYYYAFSRPYVYGTGSIFYIMEVKN